VVLKRTKFTRRGYIKKIRVRGRLRNWKLLAPIILRRRKDDSGEDSVPKLRHGVRVPMGLGQRRWPP
jgi:hypothetical protein